jgi:hypothetical protein
LKISSTKGRTKFRIQEKLKTRYIGLYKIIQKVGLMAYKLGLPANLEEVHDVFYVSMLRKCVVYLT